MEGDHLTTVMDGIIIGSAGGAIAGITVYLVQYLHNKIVESIESKRIYKWLKKTISDEKGKQFRSTRAIASWNNVTEDRARYLCSKHNDVYLSTGEKEDLWSIDPRSRKS